MLTLPSIEGHIENVISSGLQLGDFHPVILHFPIVLFFLALLFDFIYLIRKTEYASRLGHWIVICAATVAVPTVITGLFAKELGHENNPYVDIHQNWAIATLSYSVLHASFRIYALSAKRIFSTHLFVLSSLLNVIFISITAEYGSMITRGKGIWPSHHANGAMETRNGQANQQEKIGVEEVSPAEDLMREHGVLNRVLLIYEEILRRMETGRQFSPDLLKQAAGIIHNFIENYHEKLEEEYIFPRFEKAGKMVDLITILKEQHQKGRSLTDYILAHADELKNPDQSQKIKECIEEFITMYRPHEAREDTVVFPEFKTLISQKEYDALGDIFEDKEHQLFGAEGFNNVLSDVVKIEKALGIYNLAQFTPTGKI